MWNDGLIIEIMDLSHIHLLAVTICSSRYLELPTVLHEAMQASQLEVRPEFCFSELSWPLFSSDYSAFHYLALA